MRNRVARVWSVSAVIAEVMSGLRTSDPQQP
jgi:hypothetical protein